MRNKVKISLVKDWEYDKEKGVVIHSYRITKLVGAVSIEAGYWWKLPPARVGDKITEEHAGILAGIRDYEVTVTEAKEKND